MNYREMAIITAYTGVSMFQGEELGHFYEYLSEIYGRPIYTHEIPLLNIKEKSKPDFLKLCAKGGVIQRGEWIMHIDDLFPEESTEECSGCHEEQRITGNDDNFCPACGLPMTDEAVEILKKREAK